MQLIKALISLLLDGVHQSCIHPAQQLHPQHHEDLQTTTLAKYLKNLLLVTQHKIIFKGKR
jgi:hypothetical protein